MQINKKSWHFWIAKHGTPRLEIRDSSNTCEYTWAIFSGILNLAMNTICIAAFTVMVIFVLCIFLVFPLVATYSWLTCSAGFGECYQTIVSSGSSSGFGMVVLSIYAGIFSAYLFGRGFYWLVNRPSKTSVSEISEPGTITLLYRSWRDKVCVKIDFTR